MDDGPSPPALVFRAGGVFMKVAVCTPMRGPEPCEAFKDSFRTTKEYRPDLEIGWAHVIGMTSLPDAYGMTVATALEWGADKLVFIDDDMSWSVDDWNWLLADRDESIVAGIYSLKQLTPDENGEIKPSVSFFPGVTETDNRGLMPIQGCGFGFVRFDRQVFFDVRKDRMVQNIWSDSLTEAQNEHLYTYFWPGITTREDGKRVRLGFDIGFGDRCRKHGHETWLDPKIRPRHHSATHFHMITERKD